MKGALIILFISCLVLLASASLPSRKSLRFNEVTGSNLSPNSVSSDNIQDWSVSNSMLQSHTVTSGKIANWAINKDHIAPGAVTTSGLAIDVIKLIIDDHHTIFSEDQRYPAPTGVEAILPVENFYFGNTIVDNPERSLAYRVSSKAKGPGTIIGWYPSKNGHLLRYQAARSLRGLSCMDVAIRNLEFDYDCQCSATDNDNDVIDIDGTEAIPCGCSVTSTYLNTQWAYSNANAYRTYTGGDGAGNDYDGFITPGLFQGWDCYDNNNFCTSLAGCFGDFQLSDVDAFDVNPFFDPQCERRDPTDAQPDSRQPDRCSSFTSVEDVNNPQEGIPSYSPSVESITIDEEGTVEMRFFGRGSWLAQAVGEIEISVVVLLDEQYGA